ncbi:hypothetical protein JTE90_013926 [Oedothorax gibbosus]|uniref:Uncharacterized protein n=1 Tax=Oedothorax gibbosus TaxID=931172 RepID=A0AAV6V3V4_9ARAC|nr:hypothetical protein JTE90_013926 [Oedothorax gibbosus]
MPNQKYTAKSVNPDEFEPRVVPIVAVMRRDLLLSLWGRLDFRIKRRHRDDRSKHPHRTSNPRFESFEREFREMSFEKFKRDHFQLCGSIVSRIVIASGLSYM